MQFLFQPLTWGFLLVGVPILVHLINMLRHRKQKWAAMDFLLESYRRNRRWVALKQWLLLAARILAMILLVAMLAKWVSSSQWLSWFGGKTTHHYVLLDDSYSMSEVDQTETAYARGLQALGGLVRSISGQPGQHQITLVRWSRAALAVRSSSEKEGPRVDSAADLIAQTVPRDPGRLLDRLNATAPTSLQLDPNTALELISPTIAENTEEKAEVYLISDLRRNEFGEPEVLRNKLQALAQADTGIHLIDCGKDSDSNLTVASIEPEQEVWAAGVPLMVRFQIRNQATQPAKNLVVKVRTIAYPTGSVTPQVEQAYSGQIMELPPIVIEQIDAGETVTRQVQVIFGSTGDHLVEVALPDDSLDADNKRWCSIQIRNSQRVLLVDGDINQANAFFVETIISPDSRLRTGMTLEKVDAAYLREVSQAELNSHDVVALLDVPRLDDQAISKLEEFCRLGGGIFCICGRNTNLKFVNEKMARAGAGFFPVELQSIVDAPDALGQAEPQLIASEHPILNPLRQLSSSPFFLLRIKKYLSVARDSMNWPGVEVVATGPAGAPLLVDRGFGEGRVLTMLTGLSSDWSNWAQDPTFVVLTLRALGYLGSFRHEPSSQPVGSSIEMIATGETILPESEIIFPAREQGARVRVKRQVEVLDEGHVSRVSFGIELGSMDRDLVDGLLRQGVFETWMITAEGEARVQNFAHNVAAAEGDLSRIASNELQRKLQGIELDIKTAEAVSGAGLNAQDAAHSTILMALLAMLLLGEQLLAYSASYHAPRLQGATR
jgi:hypothetical protein